MNEMKKDTILFLIQLPPPVNGVSVMNRALIDSPRIRERYRQIVVPISMNRAMNGLGKFALGKLFKSVGIFFSLFWALLRYRPDVVYVTVSPFGYAFCRDFFYISLIRLFRRQRILHVHGKGIASFAAARPLARWMYRLMFRNSRVVCLSERLVEDVRPVYSGRPFVVNNGVADHFRESVPRDSSSCLRVLYLSNLTPSKGVLDYIQALALLRDGGVAFTGAIVGAPAGVTETILKRRIHELKLDDCVAFLGPKYDGEKWQVLQDAEVLVFPTYFRNEAFPVSILEAMQFALPVISTGEGAIPDIVDDGKTGFLVPAHNPAAIAAKLELLAGDPDLRLAMGMAARKKYNEKYTLTVFESNMLQVLDALY